MDVGRARQIEAEFLAGVEFNLKRAPDRGRTAIAWRERPPTRGPSEDALSPSMPAGRRLVFQHFVRRGWVRRRRSGVTVASVLIPPDAGTGASGGDLPPVELGELVDHVRDLVVDPEVPHLIGVCGPSGFTDAVYRAGLELPNVTLVLIAPDAEGGWRVDPSAGRIDESTRALFDPSDASRAFERIRTEIIDQMGIEQPASVSAASVASQRRLPVELVIGVFEEAARTHPRLRLERSGNDVRLHGDTPAMPRAADTLGIVTRIRALFAEDAANAVRLADLAEQRAALMRQRDEVFRDMGRLEQREAELLAEGRAATADSIRRRLAGSLAQVRREHGLHVALAGVIGSQIDILSTHIHHLTLLQQGRQVQLPGEAELTRHATDAQALLENLQAQAEWASEPVVGAGLSTSDEEAAILREFEGRPVVEEAAELPARERPQDQAPPASTRDAEPEA